MIYFNNTNNKKINKELLKRYGVKKLITSAYHPQTNGLCERMNANAKVIYLLI